ncbi:MAG: hypothetical protein RKP73_18520 [Candidatus Contendobacter sp.]|nr:hypothetical protein [Candidatus Contendobacter sp.]
MSKNKNRPAPAVVRALVRPRSPAPPGSPLPSGEGLGVREPPPAARLWRNPILAAPPADFPEWHGGPWPLDEADLPDAPPADAPPAEDKPIYVGTFRALLRMGASLDPLDMEVRISPFDAVEIGPLLLPRKQVEILRRLLDVAATALGVAV